jgi:hypothetical protein
MPYACKASAEQVETGMGSTRAADKKQLAAMLVIHGKEQEQHVCSLGYNCSKRMMSATPSARAC